MNKTRRQVSLALNDPEVWDGIAGAACEEPTVARALSATAKAILHMPECPDRDRALNALREAGLYAGQCLHSVPDLDAERAIWPLAHDKRNI